MARVNNIKRKRYNKAKNSKFKRALAREKIKIDAEIFDFVHEPKVLVDRIRQNPCENTVERTNNFNTKLRDWALEHNVRTNCMRDLLRMLIDVGVPSLPRDPRTFLCTPKTNKIEYIANGQFWYAGIENKLRKILKTADNSMELQLNFHVDGLQLFKSSSKQFWPILGQIHGESSLNNKLNVN